MEADLTLTGNVQIADLNGTLLFVKEALADSNTNVKIKYNIVGTPM